MQVSTVRRILLPTKDDGRVAASSDEAINIGKAKQVTYQKVWTTVLQQPETTFSMRPAFPAPHSFLSLVGSMSCPSRQVFQRAFSDIRIKLNALRRICPLARDNDVLSNNPALCDIPAANPIQHDGHTYNDLGALLRVPPLNTHTKDGKSVFLDDVVLDTKLSGNRKLRHFWASHLSPDVSRAAFRHARHHS
jgi:hypothetical protein